MQYFKAAYIVFVLAGTSWGMIWTARYSRWGETTLREELRRHQEETAKEYELAVARKIAEEQKKPKKIEHPQPNTWPCDDLPPVRDPPLADKPPFPKAVVPERVCHYGAIQPNEKYTHRFRIENRGTGILKLRKPTLGCSHGPPQYWNRDVAPDGFADFEFTFVAYDADCEFEATKTIWTNDPSSPEICFHLVGRVIQANNAQGAAKRSR